MLDHQLYLIIRFQVYPYVQESHMQVLDLHTEVESLATLDLSLESVWLSIMGLKSHLTVLFDNICHLKLALEKVPLVLFYLLAHFLLHVDFLVQNDIFERLLVNNIFLSLFQL